MNLRSLRNVNAFPKTIPEYMQKHGRQYADMNHDHPAYVHWRFLEIDGSQWFEITKPLEPIKPEKKRFDTRWEKGLGKLLVIEVCDV